jgi:exosortase A-associated hydrolase 2
VTELAISLAEQGIATLEPDLYGTGDSGGDFADADWATWVSDITTAVHWSERRGREVDAILAIGLGCALACDAMRCGALRSVQRSVLWQPLFDGRRLLTQFLRLRTAASMMEDRKESVADLRTTLAAGRRLEVAGYELSSTLARDLEAVVPPARLPTALGEIAWIEIVRDSSAPLPQSSLRLIQQTVEQRGTVRALALVGEPFWSTTEIVVNRSLISHTVAHFSG